MSLATLRDQIYNPAMGTMVKTLRSLVLTCAAVFGLCAISPPPASAADMVSLADSWWGASVDAFPGIAGLQPGDYARGPHPSNPSVEVILPRKGAITWEPAGYPPFSFEFTKADGLREISIFFSGRTQDEAVAGFAHQYGQPIEVLRAVGLATYVWKFPKTVAEINFLSVRLYPRGLLKE